MAAITKTLGSSHSGWTGDTGSGGGKQYDDNICRYLDDPASPGTTYYVYNYGFGFLGTETIDGVYVQLHAGGREGSVEVQFVKATLCNVVTKRGTGKTAITDSDVPDCSGTLYRTFGGSSDKWGLSQANINTYVRDNSAFGIAIELTTTTQATWWFDGFRITVYYTPLPPPGYPQDVNDVPNTNIYSISEVLTSNIYSVNDKT